MTSDSCFLCRVDQRLVYARNGQFFAMLGLGPLVEGYSIVATTDHIPSMLDLTSDGADALCHFTRRVRSLLERDFGRVVITEHGRVAPCDYKDRRANEKHCFHAHRLVFPVAMDIVGSLRQYGLSIVEFPSFLEMHDRFEWEGEYLYCERSDGSCAVARARGSLVRQFFRFKVAEHLGKPELADWRRYPRTEIVEAALARLTVRGKGSIRKEHQ